MGGWPANKEGWTLGCGAGGWPANEEGRVLGCGVGVRPASEDGRASGPGVRDGLVGRAGWQVRWGPWGGRCAGHRASVGRLCPTR